MLAVLRHVGSTASPAPGSAPPPLTIPRLVFFIHYYDAPISPLYSCAIESFLRKHPGSTSHLLLTLPAALLPSSSLDVFTARPSTQIIRLSCT
eukprot:768394-Hanusia_phi.AAC.5